MVQSNSEMDEDLKVDLIENGKRSMTMHGKSKKHRLKSAYSYLFLSFYFYYFIIIINYFTISTNLGKKYYFLCERKKKKIYK